MHYIKVGKDVFGTNNEIAHKNKHIFQEHGIYVVNIMSAPGAGKTTFLEQIIPKIKEKYKVGVIEGDMQGNLDEQRIAKLNIKTHQINTGALCHLDASMIHKSLASFDIHGLDLLIIENVGNLVCPAEFELGEDEKLMIVSVAEGDEKPRKYPVMFRAAHTVILNKIDLLEVTNFNKNRFLTGFRDINPSAKYFEISAVKNDGLDKVAEHIIKKIMERKQNVSGHTHEA